MYPFVFLAPILALLAGQAEPTNDPGAAEAPGAQEAPPAVSEPRQDQRQRPPRAERPRPSPGGVQERLPPARSTAEPERTQVARAALAFLDALLAGDASRLAAASAERFSFDGDLRTGKEEIHRAWRTLLAGRDTGPQPVLLDLELLPAADAVSRLGPPPPRLAPLAGVRGSWVAIANVSRRPVVLFVAREGGRWAVMGME